MAKAYQLTRDPVFYLMAVLFALFTTGLSAFLGQLRFMPISQTIALSLFMALALRRRDLRAALSVVALWLVTTMLVLIVLTLLAPTQVERAFADGFLHRAAFSEWYFTGSPLPASFTAAPFAKTLEIAGITVGSLLTGGVVGVWSLVRLANLTAFSAGHLLGVLESPLWIFVALPIWSLLQLVGATGLVALCAEPMLVDRFAFRQWLQRRRRELAIFGALYAIGLIAEAVLPAFWHFHGIFTMN
ncbi:hypothetical protein [Caldilinea sp.]|jgi:hypothetical protein|uniref:hypothetical protein n=1 Tax=Caldilinea sp. TaxID=2293560 RepID=UPI001B2DB1F9|nr:hypothetical protein [Caldilinea sp.]MBO9393146.1 hypothetical protein [Caldilinea sp.]